jgi:hypothetical protein
MTLEVIEEEADVAIGKMHLDVKHFDPPVWRLF